MNKSLAFAAASLAVTATATAAPNDNAGSARRPNIILFLVDDMGWQDTSLPFWTERTQYNKVYETPNMERLARQGMMFTQAYAASVSSPSRCSLITGANNARHRVTNWTLERDKSVDLPSDVVDCPDWNINGVSQVAGTPHTYVGTSFVELLRHSGYHTIHCGKAHFGAMDTPGENPTHWGFEVNIAGHAAGGLATNPTWRDGELFHQNYPLLSGKCSLYEGGIREPMIVSWPGVTRAGSKCDKYTMIEDFYPTILEMAGVNKYKTVAPVDGISFVPMLRETGDTSKGRALVWNFPNIWGNNGPGINLNCAIRKDEWKLIYYYDTGRKELFNIPADISEQHNVAAEHKDIVKRLSRELGEYLRRVGAQRPTFKSDGKPCPWPDEV